MATSLKIKPFDAAEFLDTQEAVAAFLADALDSGDGAVFQEALQTAARARGMSEVADAAGLGRESLYKALRPDAHPRFDTVQKVVSALGVKFTIYTPKAKRAKPKAQKNVEFGHLRLAAAKATPAKPSPARKAAKNVEFGHVNFPAAHRAKAAPGKASPARPSRIKAS